MKENNGSSEPIVLGLLKKQKTSKPAFVIIVFLLLVGVCFALPTIQDYLKDPNTTIGGIIFTLFGPSDEEDPEDKIVITKDTIHILNTSTNISFDTIILTNVILKNNTVTYTIKTKTGSLNLDEAKLYLEVYGSNNNLLKKIKLIGTIDTTEKVKSYTLSDLKFNSAVSYYGRIQSLTEEDYKEVNSINSLTCILNGHNYTYNFVNNELKSVNHRFIYNNTSDIEVYMNELNYYNLLSSKIIELGSTSQTGENDVGFDFNAELDLSKIKVSDLGEYIDYNYYKLDEKAKVISFEMPAKGFVCQ